MAEIKNQEEPTFPTKRKPEPNSGDSVELPKKAQKLATLDQNSLPPADGSETFPNINNNLEVPSSNCSSVTEEKIESDVVATDGGNVDEEDDSDDEYDDGGGDDDDEDDEDGEDSNGDAEVDRKGKGVLRDDKGKGKLIEEDDDSDDNDSADDGSVSGGDSDLSDDPLVEVDLNNILPSRTRRRTTRPGVHIASDMVNNDDDDSDDSDA